MHALGVGAVPVELWAALAVKDFAGADIFWDLY